MKKTKRIAALACAGVVAAGMAIAPVSAATTKTGDVTVSYISGAIDSDGNADHVIVLPANVVFTSAKIQGDMTVKCKALDQTVGLPKGLSVSVQASTVADPILKDASGSGITAPYTATWAGDVNNKQLKAGKTSVDVATFNNTFNGWNNNGTTLELSQAGTVDITDLDITRMNKAPNGTLFQDIITFTIRDNTDYSIQ